jgi:gliding motility-associated-like protein
MKKLLLLLFLFCSYAGYTQIITKDTVCANSPTTIYTADSSYHYAWDTVHIDPSQALGGFTQLFATNSFSNAACYQVKYDPSTGNYYGFGVNTNNAFYRVNLGTNSLNPAGTVTSFGTLSSYLSSGFTYYVDVVKDTTGKWYAFITDGGHLIRVDFGYSLGNTPNVGTDVHSINITGVSRAMQVSLYRYNGHWIGFVGDGSSTVNHLTRIDFGTDITNLTPTFTALPNGTNAFSNPSYFALYNDKIAGTFSMLVTDRGAGPNGSGLSRYDFGGNLQNNTPTATSLGNLGGNFTGPRGITIVETCDSFYALATYGGFGGQNFAHLTFNNGTTTSITNTPGLIGLGTMGTTGNSTKISVTTFWHNDSLYVATPSNGVIWTANWFGLSTGGGQVTYTPQATYTFAPGFHTITLWADQGNQMHRGYYCKTIYAVQPGPPKLGHDTTACNGDSLILNVSIVGNGTPNYTWSTGATTPTITVKAGGAYSVTVSGAGLCTTGNSNIQIVQFVPRPVVTLPADTTICSGTPLKLFSSGTYSSGVLYSWSTGATTDTIYVNTTGSVTETINYGGCSGSGTMYVTANPTPVVNLGHDTTFCSGYELDITSSQPNGATFLWNTGLADSTIAITKSGTYILTVTLGGCPATDTININVAPAPVFSLGNDTVICNNSPITIGFTNPNAVKYVWSVDSTLIVHHAANYADSSYYKAVDSTDAYITTLTGGIFSLTIYTGNGAGGGCAYTDTISIISQPGPIVHMNALRYDTVCKNKPITLDAGLHTGYTYLWNTGATTAATDVNASGDYSVIVKAENNCASFDTISVYLVTVPKQGLLGNDTMICNDQQLMLPPFVDSSLHFVWNSFGSEAITSFDTTAKYIYVHDAPGLYIATVSNRCGTTVDSINVQNKFCSLWIPNVFTPNGDGVNDLVGPMGDLSAVTNYTLTVYDRWGTVLFTSTNPYKGWDGKFNGKAQISGVYIYNLKFNVKNIPYTQNGNVTLLR